MKKIILLVTFLFGAIQGAAFANVPSITAFSTSSDVTVARLESQRSAIVSAFQNIEGGGVNIKVGSLASQDFATSVSLPVFRDEAFNDFTYSGMLPATSANLTSDISAGTSYVSGYRIENAATSHTYTASKDTYVYINETGSYKYEEVANGAAAPATPSKSLLLAKVVTNGAAITSVSDLRTTSIQITTTTTNFPANFRDSGIISRDSTTAVHATVGNIAIGSTIYSRITNTTSKTTSTATDWIEGSAPNLGDGATTHKAYVYAYNNSGSSWDIKFCSADPAYSDTSSNTGGTLRYYTTGGVWYRALAWISADSTGAINPYGYSNWLDKGILNRVTYRTGAYATGTTTIPYDNTIPEKTEGDQYMTVAFRPTNASNLLKVDVIYSGSNSNGSGIVALFRDNDTYALAAVKRESANNYMHTTMFTHEMTAGTTSPIIFRVRAGGQAGTEQFNGNGSAIFNGASISSITVTEYEN